MRTTARPTVRRSVRFALLGVAASPAVFVAIVAGASVLGERALANEVDTIARALAMHDAPSEATIDRIAREHEVRITLYDPEGAIGARRDHGPRRDNALGIVSMAEPAEVPEADALSDAMRDEVQSYGVARWCETRADGATRRCASAHRGADGSIVLVDRSVVRGVGRFVERPLPLVSLVLVALLAGFALSRWLSQRLVRPLVRLRDGVEARRRGSSAPIPRDGPVEIGEVADAFDLLLVHLDEARAAKERFVAELAHEVKTPLASIRAAGELLESDLSGEQRARLLANVERATRRIDTSLAALLELSRVEARADPIESVALDALVRGVVAAMEEERVDRTIAIVVDADAVGIEARPRELERALRALLENALSFARARVEVRVRGATRGARIEVCDDGPGFPSDVPVFERFVSARPGGTGLGLALVAAVAQSHGGSAWIETGEGGRVVLELGGCAR